MYAKRKQRNKNLMLKQTVCNFSGEKRASWLFETLGEQRKLMKRKTSTNFRTSWYLICSIGFWKLREAGKTNIFIILYSVLFFVIHTNFCPLVQLFSLFALDIESILIDIYLSLFFCLWTFRVLFIWCTIHFYTC